MKKWAKVLIISLASVLGVACVGVGVVGIIFRDEIGSYASIKHITSRNEEHQDGSAYYFEAHGDYYFDEFLKQGGAKNDKELISFMVSHLTHGIYKPKIAESDIGCSAFTATLENGNRVFGRNYDLSETNAIVYKVPAKEGRHASIACSDLQYLGLAKTSDVTSLINKLTMTLATYTPLDGMNDQGVCMSIHVSNQGMYYTEDGKSHLIATDINTDKPDINSTTMLRLVLDYADDVDSALNLIQQYDLHDDANCSFHYMLTDKTGKSAILEWVNGTSTSDNDAGARQLRVWYMNDDDQVGTKEAQATNYQWMTNFIVTPGYFADDEDDKKVGLDRYNVLGDTLVTNNGILKDEDAAMNLLEEVGRRKITNDGVHLTVYSCVYNQSKLTLDWVANEHYGEKAYTYHFSI